MWVYQQTERSLWTVGYYDPKGVWHGDSYHETPEKAAERVHYLNGGQGERLGVLEKRIEALENEQVHGLKSWWIV